MQKRNVRQYIFPCDKKIVHLIFVYLHIRHGERNVVIVYCGLPFKHTLYTRKLK